MPLFSKNSRREAEPAPVAKLRTLLEPNRLFNRRSIADFRGSRSRSNSPRPELMPTGEQVVQRAKIPITSEANSGPHVNGLDMNTLDLTLKPTPPTSEDARSITPPIPDSTGPHADSANSSLRSSEPRSNHRSLDHPPRHRSSTDAASSAVPNPGMGQNGDDPSSGNVFQGWEPLNDTARGPDHHRETSETPLANGATPSVNSGPTKSSGGSFSAESVAPPATSRPVLSIDTGDDDGGRPSMDTAGFATPLSSSPTSSGVPDVFTTPRRSLEADVAQHSTFSAIDDIDAGLPPAPLGELRRPSLTNGERQRRISTMSTPSISPVGSPRKLSAVLHSPPMPQPIANLPTLGGLSRVGPLTPSWGALALEGGPKSPQLRSPTVQHPGAQGSGFPFFAAAASGESASRKNSKDMTDAEVRKATKSMVRKLAASEADAQPVMFRMPSRHAEDIVDGGEAEDDDDVDEDVTDSEEGHATPTTQPTLARAQSSRVDSMPSPVTEEGPTGSSITSTPGVDAESSEWHLPPRSQNGPHWVSFVTSPAATTPQADNYFAAQPRTSSLSGQANVVASPDADDTPSTISTAESPIDASSHSEEFDDGTSAESVGESSASAAQSVTIQTPPSETVLRRPVMYTQASQSMFNLQSPRTETAPPLPVVDEGLPEWAQPPPTPSVKSPQLKRRLSASDAAPPPMYEPLAAFGAPGPAPRPRDEEGREKLPGYWCGVHIEGTLSRKMEFIQPGVQAKDRGWKKFYFVLHGTALYVYKFDPSKVPLRQGEPYLTCSSTEAERYLHVHLAPEQRARTPTPAPAPTPSPVPSTSSTTRRNTVGLEGALGRTPIGTIAHAVHSRRSTVSSPQPPPRPSGPDQKNPDLFVPPTRVSRPIDVASSTASAPIASHLPFAHNGLLHSYSLTGAESGLAADYKKRLHCVRVRAEGQQFMLQTDTARQCVQWIEAFQAATNVAMDLDVRPMPIQHTLPRRRRRARRPQTTAANGGEAATDNANDASFADTPEGNIAAVEAAERAQRERDEAEHRRERMLEEDQANAGRPHGGLL